MRWPSSTLPWLLLLAVGLLGCAESHSRAADVDKPARGFESDVLEGVGESVGLYVRDGVDDLGDPTAGEGPAWGDAASAVADADVIQLAGDRLYTLSRLAGLSVIDVGNPDGLRILGRCRALPADPIAMYLRDEIVIALFSGWGRYAMDDVGRYQWVRASKVVALDATDPTRITALGTFDVPGTVTNSRLVGSALYLVAHQDGQCAGCEQDRPRSTILSLDVGDPRDLRKVDELALDDTAIASDGDALGISLSEQRIYAAGPAHGVSDPQGTTIQVIDISDPAGDIVVGDSVEVAEQIGGPEYMDEYEDVLRVISQPPRDIADPPRVRTFRVVSSAELQPLGSTTLEFPREEQAYNVRFDGPRAYAFPVPPAQTDRLFTIDLSDPTQPAQGATVAMGGRNLLHSIQPLGDRLLGLGADWDNSPGSITMSLYDVSDLASPSLIERVHLADDLGTGTGIDRGFTVLDEAGLILVPFRDTDFDDGSGQAYCGTYRGGMQLIDFGGDSLTVHGKARVDDGVRRALLLEDRLLTVSDERVEAFDITDRDAPRTSGKTLLARQEQQAFELDNGSVARLYIDSWSAAPSVDFVATSEAEEPNASLGAIDLRVLGVDAQCAERFVDTHVPLYVFGAFARGDQVEIVYEAGNDEEAFEGLAIIDGTDPTAPTLLSNTTWTQDPSGWHSVHYFDPKALVRTDGAIVILERQWIGGGSMPQRLRVLDVSDPSAPSSSLLDLPATQPYAGLIAVGDTVMTSHAEPGEDDAAQARFYLDRFDLSDPTRLVQDDPVNIPGALMHVDRDSGDLLTSELVRQESQADTTEECFERYAFPDREPDEVLDWGGPTGPCVGYTQRLHLVSIDAGVAKLEDTLTFEDDEYVRSVAAGDGAVFASMGFGGYYYGYYATSPDCLGRTCGYGDGVARPAELLTLAGFGKGRLQAGRITAQGQGAWLGLWGTPSVYAAGSRALLVGRDELAIVDATDTANPILVRTEPVYGTPRSVQVSSAGKALLSLHLWGLQRVDLE